MGKGGGAPRKRKPMVSAILADRGGRLPARLQALILGALPRFALFERMAQLGPLRAHACFAAFSLRRQAAL